MLEFIEKFLERRRMEREGQLGTRKRRKESVLGAAADRSLGLIFALLFVLWSICVLVLTFPEHRNYPTLVASQIAPETIFARADFFYEDKAETRRLQQETAKLQPLYFKFSDDETEVIKQNLEHTGFSKKAVVVQSDALSFLSRRTEKYDIALIDPPYSKGLVEAALEKVHEVMNEGGVIICEAPYKDELPEEAGTFRLHKKYRYGKTGLFLYRFAQEEE
jgi:23S rRNA G2445 N2-methylase RlmL